MKKVFWTIAIILDIYYFLVDPGRSLAMVFLLGAIVAVISIYKAIN
jgi:hypothetical protein